MKLEKFLSEDVLILEHDEHLEETVDALLNFVSSLRVDSLSDEQYELLEQALDFVEENELLNEKIKRVVRGGKVMRKKVCKEGYKAQGNKCVRIDPTEKRNRERSQKKAARKRKVKSKAAVRKRARSMKKVT